MAVATAGYYVYNKVVGSRDGEAPSMRGNTDDPNNDDDNYWGQAAVATTGIGATAAGAYGAYRFGRGVYNATYRPENLTERMVEAGEDVLGQSVEALIHSAIGTVPGTGGRVLMNPRPSLEVSDLLDLDQVPGYNSVISQFVNLDRTIIPAQTQPSVLQRLLGAQTDYAAEFIPLTVSDVNEALASAGELATGTAQAAAETAARANTAGNQAMNALRRGIRGGAGAAASAADGVLGRAPQVSMEPVFGDDATYGGRPFEPVLTADVVEPSAGNPFGEGEPGFRNPFDIEPAPPLSEPYLGRGAAEAGGPLVRTPSVLAASGAPEPEDTWYDPTEPEAIEEVWYDALEPAEASFDPWEGIPDQPPADFEPVNVQELVEVEPPPLPDWRQYETPIENLQDFNRAASETPWGQVRGIRPFSGQAFETVEGYTTRYLSAFEDAGAARGYGVAYDSAVAEMAATARFNEGAGRYGGLEIEDPALSVRTRAPLAFLNQAPESRALIRVTQGLKVAQKAGRYLGPLSAIGLSGFQTYETERARTEGLITDRERWHQEFHNYTGVAGGLGGGVLGSAAAGFFTGVAAGAETGPGAIVTGVVGGILGGLAGTNVAHYIGDFIIPPEWPHDHTIFGICAPCLDGDERVRIDRNSSDYAYMWKERMGFESGKYLDDAELGEAQNKYALAYYLQHGRDAPRVVDIATIPEKERYHGYPHGMSDTDAWWRGRGLVNQMAADGTQVYYTGVVGDGADIGGGLHNPDQWGIVYKHRGTSYSQGRTQAQMNDEELDNTKAIGATLALTSPFYMSALGQYVGRGWNRDADPQHIDWQAIFYDGPQAWWSQRARDGYAELQRTANIEALQYVQEEQAKATARRLQEQQYAQMLQNNLAEGERIRVERLHDWDTKREEMYIDNQEAHAALLAREQADADTLGVEQAVHRQGVVDEVTPSTHVQGPGMLTDDPKTERPPRQTTADSSSNKLPIFGDALNHMVQGVLPPKDQSIHTGNPLTENVTFHEDIVRPVSSGEKDRRGMSVWNPDFIHTNTAGVTGDRMADAGYLYHQPHKPENPYSNLLLNVLYAATGAVVVKAIKG